jgi:hypothetical protein
VRHVDGSGHMREAHEDVEVDGAIGVPSLRCGDDLTEHLTPPHHRPEKRRAHARRLEYLSEVRGVVRVREDQGALVLRHPPRMAQVDGDTQAVLLRWKPVLSHQEMVLAVRCDEEDARVCELVLTGPEPARTEVRLFIPQDLLRRRREVPECALDGWRAVGGPRRFCERRQRLCSQRVDVALSHRAPAYGLSPQSLARVPLRLFGA